MSKYSGTVQFVNQNEVNGKTLHSFKLFGDKHFSGSGTMNPNVNKGDYISYEAEVLANGNLKVDVASIEKGSKEAVVTKGAVHGATAQIMGKVSLSKDEYWNNKEARDVEVQKTIQLQASRNAAIALSSAILQAGAVPGYEKARPADKMDIITGLVDHLTERFQGQISESKNVSKSIEDVPVTEDTAQSVDTGKWE